MSKKSVYFAVVLGLLCLVSTAGALGEKGEILFEYWDGIGGTLDNLYGTYTLSMLANGDAKPVVLELLADGVALTPSASVDPVLSSDWQEFSRTYDAASLQGHIGASLTIRLGVGRGASGGQSHFDAVSLSYVPQ